MWEYRVIKCDDEDLEPYRFVEVYYEDDGTLMGYCEIRPFGKTIEALREELEVISTALSQPVLSESDFKI